MSRRQVSCEPTPREYIGCANCQRCGRLFAIEDRRETVCGKCRHPDWHKHGWSGEFVCWGCQQIVLTTDEQQRLCAECWQEWGLRFAEVIDPGGERSAWEVIEWFAGT